MAYQTLQLQRFENKYLIPERVALQVRDFVSAYLDIDEFGATRPELSYPVHSLYLDSDALDLYHRTINGDKNRYKLRLRFYHDRSDAPVFFEIKRRCNNTIIKQRGGVRRRQVEALLAGHLPYFHQLLSPSPQEWVALQKFCELMSYLRARPKAHIAYLREAWNSRHDNSVRVTMDREVRCVPDPTARLTTRMERPVYPFRPNVILELKFTGRYPNWFRELVRVFGLMQCGAAKYVDGITLLGTYQVNQTFVLPERPPPLFAGEAAPQAADDVGPVPATSAGEKSAGAS